MGAGAGAGVRGSGNRSESESEGMSESGESDESESERAVRECQKLRKGRSAFGISAKEWAAVDEYCEGWLPMDGMA